jgi:hypothetical protein
MPILDSVLPSTIDPTMRHVINGLVGIHLCVFFLFIVLLCRSFMKGPQDHFKDQVGKMERNSNTQKKNLKED